MGDDSQNATNFEFSFIWVFHLNATEAIQLSAHTTVTLPSNMRAKAFA